MSCTGVFFALTKKQEKKIKSLVGDNEQILAFVQKEIEENWDEDNLAECDKAWDAMHRCLSDGTLNYEEQDTILSKCVLNGEQLYEDPDYIVSFKSVTDVVEIAIMIDSITVDWMRERYSKLTKTQYDGPIGKEDFEYTWTWFESVRELYRKAAQRGRSIVFTVDQ